MPYVYFIDNEYGLTKIGRTKKNPLVRMRELPFPNLTMRFFFETDIPSKLEVALHSRFRLSAEGREWFDLSEYTDDVILNTCKVLNEGIKITTK